MRALSFDLSLGVGTDLCNLAGAFYGYKTVIVPHNLPAEKLSAHLQRAEADVLIAEAGSLDLSLMTKDSKQLSLVIWVAKYGNRHMDWNFVPENVKDSLKVAVWHELVEEYKNLASYDVPEYDPKTKTPTVTTVWPSSSQSSQFIDFQPEVKYAHPSDFAFADIQLESCIRHWSTVIRSATSSTFYSN